MHYNGVISRAEAVRLPEKKARRMDRNHDKVFDLKPIPPRKRRATKRNPDPEPDDPFPDERDIAAIRGEIIDMGKRCGYRPENLNKWPQRDSYESLLFMERWEAHQVAKELVIDVEAAWSRRKMRPWQEVEFVINGPFDFSKHYDSKFRAAWAQAWTEYPTHSDSDIRKRADRATEIVMAHGNRATWEAFHTYSFENVSIFDELPSGSDSASEPQVRLELIEDPSSSGRDPQEVRTFLYALLDDSDLSERQKDVVEMIAYEGLTNMTEMGRRLGVSDTTIDRDIQAIKESSVWVDWIGPVENLPAMTYDPEQDPPEPPLEEHLDDTA